MPLCSTEVPYMPLVGSAHISHHSKIRLTRVLIRKPVPKERHYFGNVFLSGFRRLWRFHLVRFVCSGGVNPPDIKIFAYIKMLGTPYSQRLFLQISILPSCGIKKGRKILSFLPFFVDFAAFRPLYPYYLICSGQVNWPGIKISVPGKNAFTPHSRRIFSGRKRTDGCARSHQAAQKSASLDAPVSVQNTL